MPVSCYRMFCINTIDCLHFVRTVFSVSSPPTTYIILIRLLSLSPFAELRKTIHGILITSSYMTTVAIFLHTLKFKGWLGPRQATVAYEGAYLVTAWLYWQFLGTIAANLDLALLCFIGMVLNFAPKGIWHTYQAFVLAYLWYARATWNHFMSQHFWLKPDKSHQNPWHD